MKLTVAMKIIGGFTIISVLLILTSVISWNSLNTISDATKQQDELAIPTLKESNILAKDLTSIGNLTLRAYYQTSLEPLAVNQKAFNNETVDFREHLDKLKIIVQNEPTLLSNLHKIDPIYNKLDKEIKSVLNNRKFSIEQYITLTEKIDAIEESADDTATILLDLGDHDLASTKLQRAVSLAERLEMLLNSIVSSSFEYREIKDQQSATLVSHEIENTFSDIEKSVIDVVSELKLQGTPNIADDLTDSFSTLQAYISGSKKIFTNKNNQLSAISAATTSLKLAEDGIYSANEILDKQVELANKTTITASALIEKSVSAGTRNTSIITFISIALAIIIAWVTLTSITRPLRRVNEMLHVVASGDLSRKLDESGNDEFAQLSHNCNLLIESLRMLIQSIVSRSTQLATAAEQTSAVTAQSTTAIEEQRIQVEQAASATTEMSSTAQSVLSSANDALGEIKQADDEAERVKVISGRNRQTIELLANEVESASQVINKLQQDSASIGSILDVIRGIAEQTNLLALNAAIEAARAGEQGRGFAVVADEVRTLASRTQESTQEIQNMIEVLQGGAEKAVSVMETGKKQATNCVEQSVQAEQALDTITHAVHEAFDRSSQIATAAEEQSVVAHEISENLESIVAIAEQTTAGSKQTAESSSEVARLAEELQHSVQEFKI
ncbi:MAG: methyl-accepting chemotaxis protein [Colwellia polaris]|jgi:methyl-accepting chemotaxis protein|uniref:methyl-accepting chemotaxis protein n=1 Tax=Colwellia polaris TaxID=326537 RepID=UPI000A16ED12|nr:methyl-accepting chemotaxis protein [Colwellia polaris]|tara:strand:+ start:18036 stop:20054 length:2019 start_codon:yes stop_codon:yes gene_type:complete